jgi:predicted alpha/beta-hydrolase family hydrolase
MAQSFRIEIAPSQAITALAYPSALAGEARACLILAHGAGGTQASPVMVQFATALAAWGIATVTFNFLYSENRRRLPDRNDKLEACYRKVIQAYREGSLGPRPGGRLIIGGKSMGGRIASQILATGGTETGDVEGLILLGYPLHPPGRPEMLRAKHLPGILVPILIVQGEKDAFGTPEELRPFLRDIQAPVELCVVEGGDHSFKVPKSAGRTPAEVHDFVLGAISRWVEQLPAGTT